MVKWSSWQLILQLCVTIVLSLFSAVDHIMCLSHLHYVSVSHTYVCVCVCVCAYVCVCMCAAAFPTSSLPASKLSGSLPTATYGDSYLTTPTSAPPGATPMDLLGVGMSSAHSRQPSDSGSIGSTGSSARPPASGSPQHQLQPFGYSLISQNHGDGGGGGIAHLPPRGRSNTTMSSAGFPHQPMRRIKSPQDIKPRPTSARRSRHIDFHQSGTKNREEWCAYGGMGRGMRLCSIGLKLSSHKIGGMGEGAASRLLICNG